MFGQGFSVIGIFLMDHFRGESGTMTPFLMVFTFLTILNLAYLAFLRENSLLVRES